MRRLVEWGVFLFIVCLLIGIALPNNVGGGGPNKTSSVKANMHTLQTMVETYAVDWSGIYPNSLDELKRDGMNKKKGYWKELKNPYSNLTGKGAERAYNDLSDSDLANMVFDKPLDVLKEGVIGYVPIIASGGTKNTSYAIYGSGKDGKYVTDKGNNIFFLSNI